MLSSTSPTITNDNIINNDNINNDNINTDFDGRNNDNDDDDEVLSSLSNNNDVMNSDNISYTNTIDEDNNSNDNDNNNTTDNDGNIFVAVRCRPPNRNEKNHRTCVEVLKDDDNSKVVILQSPHKNANDFLRMNRSRERRYAFDHVFDKTATQEQVYEKTAKPLIDAIMQGYNATMFAYGQTGSGKTHTMIGDPEHPGIMVQTLRELFNKANQQQEHMYKIMVSFLEVYNENIRDLLNPESGVLELREDPVKGMEVAGITELVANSSSDVMKLLRMGHHNRTTEPTAANLVSSRSHAVLQVVVESKDSTANISENICVGKLSLIDLAGSERAAVTQNRGIRMVEGANINRSLLALANCINALASKTPGQFVPYRDSKLTRLLKDSLGGNCRTVMITCISPSELSYEETHNSLKYANRAKNIKTKAVKNVFNVQYHIARYTQIIKQLRTEVQQLKVRLMKRTSIADEKNHNSSNSRSTVSITAAPTMSIAMLNEADDLRSQFMEGFAEIISLKRELIEKSEQNFEDQFQLSKLRAQLTEPQNSQNNETSLAIIRSEINVREIAVQDYLDNKERMQDRIQQVHEEMDALMESVPKIIKDSQLRSLLELEYQLHSTEVAKLHYEETGFLQEVLVKQMELDVARLQEQLQIRDQMIARQRQELETNHLKQPSLSNFTDYVTSEYIQKETGYVNDLNVRASTGQIFVSSKHPKYTVRSLSEASSHYRSRANKDSSAPDSVMLSRKKDTKLPQIRSRNSNSRINNRSHRTSVLQNKSITSRSTSNSRSNSKSRNNSNSRSNSKSRNNSNSRSNSKSPNGIKSLVNNNHAKTRRSHKLFSSRTLQNSHPKLPKRNSPTPVLVPRGTNQTASTFYRSSPQQYINPSTLQSTRIPLPTNDHLLSHSTPYHNNKLMTNNNNDSPLRSNTLDRNDLLLNHSNISDVDTLKIESPIRRHSYPVSDDHNRTTTKRASPVAKRFTKQDRLKLLRRHNRKKARMGGHKKVLTKKQIEKQKEIMKAYGATTQKKHKKRVHALF